MYNKLVFRTNIRSSLFGKLFFWQLYEIIFVWKISFFETGVRNFFSIRNLFFEREKFFFSGKYKKLFGMTRAVC